MNKNQNFIRPLSKPENAPTKTNHQTQGVQSMNKNQNPIRPLPTPFNANSISPISIQHTTQTHLTGTMTSAQVDREQDIKVLGICAGAAVVLGGIFMLCSAFGNRD